MSQQGVFKFGSVNDYATWNGKGTLYDLLRYLGLLRDWEASLPAGAVKPPLKQFFAKDYIETIILMTAGEPEDRRLTPQAVNAAGQNYAGSTMFQRLERYAQGESNIMKTTHVSTVLFHYQESVKGKGAEKSGRPDNLANALTRMVQAMIRFQDQIEDDADRQDTWFDDFFLQAMAGHGYTPQVLDEKVEGLTASLRHRAKNAGLKVMLVEFAKSQLGPCRVPYSGQLRPTTSGGNGGTSTRNGGNQPRPKQQPNLARGSGSGNGPKPSGGGGGGRRPNNNNNNANGAPKRRRRAKCPKCYKRGHSFDDCENPWTCAKCGESGHMAAQCGPAEGQADAHADA